MQINNLEHHLISTHDSDQLESSLAALVIVHDQILFSLANFCLYFFIAAFL